MAHAILAHEVQTRSLHLEVYSAGIVDFSDQPPLIETARTCLYYNTPSPKQMPTWVAQLPLASIDRFLVMESDHAEALRRQFGVPDDRITLLGTFDPQQRGAEITDPFFSYNEDVYKSSYSLIRDCIIGYLERAEEIS